MRHILFILISTAILLVAVVLSITAAHKANLKLQELAKHKVTTKMKITSSAFNLNDEIPVKYTCKGENINPPLSISDVPGNTRTLAFIMDDPDAPGGTFVHWVVYNINPSEREIDENSVFTAAIEGKNGSGKTGYTGPCPPSGAHRYFFKLYALDQAIDSSAPLEKADLVAQMQGHILAETQLVGLSTH